MAITAFYEASSVLTSCITNSLPDGSAANCTEWSTSGFSSPNLLTVQHNFFATTNCSDPGSEVYNQPIYVVLLKASNKWTLWAVTVEGMVIYYSTITTADPIDCDTVLTFTNQVVAGTVYPQFPGWDQPGYPVPQAIATDTTVCVLTPCCPGYQP